MQTDERISLAAAMYEPCMVGADIGTDHAYLPAELLTRGVCQRMLLCELSPSALTHARNTVQLLHLKDRTRLLLGNGLDPVDEKCGCISIMGMGGETMSGILRRGASRLQEAVLVLSAHTQQEAVRRAVMDLNYHFTREELCRAAGRLYVLWRAEPGSCAMTEEQLRRGSLLWQQDTELTRAYAANRLTLTEERIKGARHRRDTLPAVLDQLESDRAFYQSRL